MSTPLYTLDGDRFAPSEHTRGPWSPDAQHGGAPAALMTRAMEALPTDAEMTLVRVTVEILRPVPLSPLAVSASIERPGRRVQLLRASLTAGGAEVCRAQGWRVRVTDLGPGVHVDAPLPFDAPDTVQLSELDPGPPAFHRTGMEVRFVSGSLPEVGPAVAWFRLRRPVVDDEAPSPAMRTLAAADFGNGISSAVSWTEYAFLNTDLTVYLHRHPAGEWVCLDAVTDAERSGLAVARSTLYDERGRIGLAAQTLLVQRRPEGMPGDAPLGDGVP